MIVATEIVHRLMKEVTIEVRRKANERSMRARLEKKARKGGQVRGPPEWPVAPKGQLWDHRRLRLKRADCAFGTEYT
jgi:hypothetical protein